MLQSWYAHALSPFTLHLAVTSIHLTLALHPALTSTSSSWTFPNSDPSPVKGRVFVRTKTPNPNIVAAPRGKGCVQMPIPTMFNILSFSFFFPFSTEKFDFVVLE